MAFAAAIQNPAEGAYVRLGCPWTPIFFERSETLVGPVAREHAIASLDWIIDGPEGGDARFLLRTYSREGRTEEIWRWSEARADAVRSELISKGVPADRIYIAHEMDDGPNLAPEGWVGGWVYPEIYVTRAAQRRLFPPGGPIC
jgi:hypothetical protein